MKKKRGLRILRNGGTSRGTSGTLVNPKLLLVPQFLYKNYNLWEVPQYPYGFNRGTQLLTAYLSMTSR